MSKGFQSVELELFFIAIFVTILCILPILVTKLPEMTGE